MKDSDKAGDTDAGHMHHHAPAPDEDHQHTPKKEH